MNLKLILLTCLIASGCASQNARYQVPVPKDHAKESQLQMQAVRHWEILAQDIATQTMSELSKRKLETTPVSISKPTLNSDFSNALNNFLITHLVNKGAPIKKIHDGKLTLEYDVQVVRFESDRSNRVHSDYVPGTFTAITAGVLVLHNATTQWSWDRNSQKAALIASGAGADAFMTDYQRHDSTIDIPKVEVIVNSAIVKDGTYLMRRSDIYYVNDPDEELYNAASNSDKSLMDTIREYDKNINESRKKKGAY